MQLGKLHLELALVGASALSENIENEGGAIKNTHAHGLLDVPLLSRRELVVKNAQVHIFLLHIEG